MLNPFAVEDHGYTCSDFSPISPRESLFSPLETESSNTVIMLVMAIEVANVEEQLTSMIATLERLAKESLEKIPKSSVKVSKFRA